tara:strand:- start:1847 stop:2437 length:591 start_codon:yes stop_codon:yes gene_type:complete
MRLGVFGYLLLVLAVSVGFCLYRDSDWFQLKCIISDVDGKRYCVRERRKLALAADRLAEVNLRMGKLVKRLGKEYPDRPNCKRLVAGYDPKEIYETLPTSEFTAYSENKGEKLAFCLDTEKNGGSLIDMNTLMFVALHELSHVATESVGHTDEFWDNFRFILGEAQKQGLYTPVDYKTKPARYCGMSITDNPYFDH